MVRTAVSFLRHAACRASPPTQPGTCAASMGSRLWIDRRPDRRVRRRNLGEHEMSCSLTCKLAFMQGQSYQQAQQVFLDCDLWHNTCVRKQEDSGLSIGYYLFGTAHGAQQKNEATVQHSLAHHVRRPTFKVGGGYLAVRQNACRCIGLFPDMM